MEILFAICFTHTVHLFSFFCVFVLVQMDPIKVCSQIGLCQFGSTEQRFVS